MGSATNESANFARDGNAGTTGVPSRDCRQLRKEKINAGAPTAPILARYRCFLPDLAGFATAHCTKPGAWQFTIVAPGFYLEFSKTACSLSPKRVLRGDAGEELNFGEACGVA